MMVARFRGLGFENRAKGFGFVDYEITNSGLRFRSNSFLSRASASARTQKRGCGLWFCGVF